MKSGIETNLYWPEEPLQLPVENVLFERQGSNYPRFTLLYGIVVSAGLRKATVLHQHRGSGSGLTVNLHTGCEYFIIL